MDPSRQKSKNKQKHSTYRCFVHVKTKSPLETGLNLPCSTVKYSKGKLRLEFLFYTKKSESEMNKIIDDRFSATEIMSKPSSNYSENFDSNIDRIPEAAIKNNGTDLIFRYRIPKSISQQQVSAFGFQFTPEETWNFIFVSIPSEKKIYLKEVERTFRNRLISMERFPTDLIRNFVNTLQNNKKKAKVTYNKNSVTFFEKNFEIERNVGTCFVKVEVDGLLVKIEINLDSEIMQSAYGPKNPRISVKNNVDRLKEYFRLVNARINFGRFCVVGEKAVYVNKFYATRPLGRAPGLNDLVQKNLDDFFMYSEAIFLICCGENLGSFRVGSRCPQLLKRVELQLSPEQVSQEKVIVNELKNCKNYFFENRFHITNINFCSDNRVSYVKLREKCDLFSYVEETSESVISAIVEVTEELENRLVFFKDFHFPIEMFEWENSKPIFNYSQPLCEYIEILHTIPENYYQRILDGLMKDIYKKKVEKKASEIQVIQPEDIDKMFHNVQLKKLPKNDALERLQIYQNNPYDFVDRYYGVTESENNWSLIVSDQPKTSFFEVIFSFSRDEQFNFFTNLLEIIVTLTSKQACIGAICPDNLWLCQKNCLNVTLLGNDEIQDAFKAPEVRKGKVCDRSLVYSFGKILALFIMEGKKLLDSHGELEVPQEVQDEFPKIFSIVASCTKTVPISRLTVPVLTQTFEELGHF